MKIHLGLLTSIAASVGIFLLLAFSWGQVPALGPLLSPFHGVWQKQAPLRATKEELKLQGLTADVRVVWDEYDVPHIFAANLEDLYFAQGYVVARDRLFQMDLHSRPAAGRISELAGEVTRDFDRFFIKMGMRQASEIAYQAMLKDSQTRQAVEAYTRGVNAYIESLKFKDYPVEYLILGTKPSPWTEKRTAEFLKTMAYNLSGRSYDLFLTHHAQKWGRDKIEFLFPDRLPLEEDEFILSKTQFKSQARPKQTPPGFSKFISKIKGSPFYPQPDSNNGSNNFAVAPKKSSTGHSILANDTHLGLSLPPIWYEMQLHAPEMNVYGATFPGGPGIILGFNSEMAWGVTNGTTDVVDWYEIEFKDESSLEYLVENKWETAERIIETLAVRGGKSEEVELLRTRFGYVVLREGNLGLAMKWSVHKESNDLKAFLSLNTSKSAKACEAAIEYFESPSQNFLCADSKNIGLWHKGSFPDRFIGQGKYVMNGRDTRLDWENWVEPQRLPRAINPQEGFLRSANNVPADTENPYLGWDFEEPYRARRIRQRLEEKELLSTEDLISIQNDITDLHAKSVLPAMLSGIEASDFSEDQLRGLELLNNWDYLASEKGPEATIFETWWKNFEEELFADELGEREKSFYPRRRRSAQIFKDPKAWQEWIDRKETPEQETLAEILRDSYLKAWEQNKKNLGPFGEGWSWGKSRPTELRHVARIPGFGSRKLEVSGTRYTPKANGGRHGPTWKLVVSMEPEVKAWSYISGHNSGHPFDPNFEKNVEPWGKGEMKLVHFLKSPEDLKIEKSSLRQTLLIPGEN